MSEVIFTFHNTHDSIISEQILLDSGFLVKVMPMPEAITAGCGLCLRLNEDISEDGYKCLISKNTVPMGIYKRDNKNYIQIVY